MKIKMPHMCKECGSVWDVTICINTHKPICRSCCDVDCNNRYSCWGRYY